MAKEKCEICGEELRRGFMDKIVGTRVKIKDGGSNKFYFVCPVCQKEHGNGLKAKLKG